MRNRDRFRDLAAEGDLEEAEGQVAAEELGPAEDLGRVEVLALAEEDLEVGEGIGRGAERE